MKERTAMTQQITTKLSTAPDGHSLWKRPIANYGLWTIQGLLALLFLFAGGMKLVLPIAAMTKQMPLPGLFLRFLGVAEVLGAIGLILPWLLGIRRELTPLAASGLVIIMIGATALTLAAGRVAGVLMPFVVGFLLSFVAYGRWSSFVATSGRPIPRRQPGAAAAA
jgi:DoxX-like family